MLQQLRSKRARRRLAMVEFCDRCGSVCDARCRAERLRDQTRARARSLGGQW